MGKSTIEEWMEANQSLLVEALWSQNGGVWALEQLDGDECSGCEKNLPEGEHGIRIVVGDEAAELCLPCSQEVLKKFEIWVKELAGHVTKVHAEVEKLLVKRADLYVWRVLDP